MIIHTKGKNTRILFTFLLICNSHIFVRAQKITYISNAIIPDGRVVKQEVIYMDPGASGKELLWDYSKPETLKRDYIVDYSGTLDSLCWLEHRTRYYYSQSKEGILCVGFENANSYIKYEQPIYVLPFSFSYGDTLSSSFNGNGEYGHAQHLNIAGYQSIKADATGTMILPNEIIKVIRITNNEHYVKTGNDNLTVDKTTYSWFSTNRRLPVFESVKTIYRMSDGKDTTAFCASFIYESDDKNIERNNNRFSEDYIADEYSNIELTAVKLYPNPVKETLEIGFQSNFHCQLDVCLYSGSGALCYSTIKTVDGGENKWHIPTGHLLNGSYIVRVSFAGNDLISKVIIKQ